MRKLHTAYHWSKPMNTAKELLQNASGHTVWFGTQYDKGYVVALSGRECRLSNELVKLETIQFYIDSLVSPLADGVGIWQDDDFTYIDSVIHVNDELEALRLGHKHKQLAVYDITHGVVIDL